MSYVGSGTGRKMLAYSRIFDVNRFRRVATRPISCGFIQNCFQFGDQIL